MLKKSVSEETVRRAENKNILAVSVTLTKQQRILFSFVDSHCRHGTFWKASSRFLFVFIVQKGQLRQYHPDESHHAWLAAPFDAVLR